MRLQTRQYLIFVEVILPFLIKGDLGV